MTEVGKQGRFRLNCIHADLNMDRSVEGKSFVEKASEEKEILEVKEVSEL